MSEIPRARDDDAVPIVLGGPGTPQWARDAIRPPYDRPPVPGTREIPTQPMSQLSEEPKLDLADTQEWSAKESFRQEDIESGRARTYYVKGPTSDEVTDAEIVDESAESPAADSASGDMVVTSEGVEVYRVPMSEIDASRLPIPTEETYTKEHVTDEVPPFPETHDTSRGDMDNETALKPSAAPDTAQTSHDESWNWPHAPVDEAQDTRNADDNSDFMNRFRAMPEALKRVSALRHGSNERAKQIEQELPATLEIFGVRKRAERRIEVLRGQADFAHWIKNICTREIGWPEGAAEQLSSDPVYSLVQAISPEGTKEPVQRALHEILGRIAQSKQIKRELKGIIAWDPLLVPTEYYRRKKTEALDYLNEAAIGAWTLDQVAPDTLEEFKVNWRNKPTLMVLRNHIQRLEVDAKLAAKEANAAGKKVTGTPAQPVVTSKDIERITPRSLSDSPEWNVNRRTKRLIKQTMKSLHKA